MDLLKQWKGGDPQTLKLFPKNTRNYLRRIG